MLDKSTAVTFVDALIEVAAKKGLFERAERDLHMVCDVITRDANLKKMLFHPSIGRDDKKKIIKKVFGESVSGLMINFLNLLIDRRREWILESIPAIYKTAIDDKKGVVKAIVQSAIPLTVMRLNNLKRRLDNLTGKTVKIEVVHDPQILGGMVVHIGNKMIDGSVASRLKNLKTRLLELQTA